MGISTDPPLLDVELPSALLESPSVSTFLPEEEASMCPLLSTNSSTPLAFSHPLTPSADNDSNNSNSGICEDTKAETSSSSGSSSGIGMDVTDTAAASLFNHNNSYHHLRKNNNEVMQDSNGLGVKGHLVMKSSNDTPSFVSWNWPLIRKCTFFIFMSSLLAMCAVVVAMIITLPKTCNPKTAWFRGSVFYEIFPASYQDSNNDGLGDLRGITKRIDYLSALGVGAVRLNSIFPAEHYPDDYNNVTSLVNIATVIGSTTDLLQLSRALHARNISLILDLPIFPYLKHLEEANEVNYTAHDGNVTEPAPLETDNLISIAIQKWIGLGVDGFYIKGLEMHTNDDNLLNNIAEWKHILGPQRALIIDNEVIQKLNSAKANKILKNVDLVDVHLNVTNGTQQIMQQIQAALKGILAPREDGPWIQWSIGGVGKQRVSRQLNGNASLTATIMQLMLPGSPNIFYGDEIALENVHDPHNEHSETKHLHHLSTMEWSDALKFTSRETLPWLPKSSSFNLENFEQVSRMIHLRDRSPSIYKNVICKASQNIPNTQVRNSRDDIIIVERIYPRRNSFVSISNFGEKMVQMDMTSMYYSGHVMLGNTQSDKIFFGEFQIGGMETIVVRLDK